MVYLLRLQSSGTLSMGQAVGAHGTVYLTIPADGAGKARVVVQNRLKIFDATSKYNEEISTGERIRVIEVASGNILVVEKVAEES
jgi:membrane-bound ClpP family serine protease